MIEIFSNTSSSLSGIFFPFLLSASFFILVGVRLATSRTLHDRRLAWLMMSFGASFPLLLAMIVLRPPITVRAPVFDAAEFDFGLLALIGLITAAAVVGPVYWLAQRKPQLEPGIKPWLKLCRLTNFAQLCAFNVVAWVGFILTYFRQSYFYCFLAVGLALMGCALLFPKAEANGASVS